MRIILTVAEIEIMAINFLLRTTRVRVELDCRRPRRQRGRAHESPPARVREDGGRGWVTKMMAREEGHALSEIKLST